MGVSDIVAKFDNGSAIKALSVTGMAVTVIALASVIFLPDETFQPRVAHAAAEAQCDLAAEVGARASDRDSACHARWRAQPVMLGQCGDWEFYTDPAEGGRSILWSNGDWFGAGSDLPTLCATHLKAVQIYDLRRAQ